VKPLAFVGRLPASKSMMNRALLAQSFFPALKIHGDSEAEDVMLMNEAVVSLRERRPIACGSAGTVLRFMALRAARESGKHRLAGEKRLFARPQDELLKILRQLGAQAKLGEDFLEIESSGWRMQGDTLLVPSDRSSQFASAVLLNAWDLPFELFVSRGGRAVSEGYWKMSEKMAAQLGMKIDFWDGDFRVPRGQKVSAAEIHIEPDMSSAFAVAAVAAVSGRATLTDFPDRSLQPDAQFASVLAAMGVPVSADAHGLKVEKAARLNGVRVNLKSTPDLFPVLAALCALAHGESDLHGAPHLVHKESDRLGRMAALIEKMGRPVKVKDDGMEILGDEPLKPGAALELDTDQDHRLAFAGAVFKSAGFPLKILHPEVVGKSLPDFWKILGWEP
jgi:3-phosphoshikimate 1-carboxyvinyltransferase